MNPWGNSWAKSWGNAWGPIANDVARSGWFRLWLIGLQEASDKKIEPEVKAVAPIVSKVVEQEDGTAIVGEIVNLLPNKRKAKRKVAVVEHKPIEVPKFEPRGVTFFEEVRDFVTNLNFPRITIDFTKLENRVKSHAKARRENDDIHALLLLV